VPSKAIVVIVLVRSRRDKIRDQLQSSYVSIGRPYLFHCVKGRRASAVVGILFILYYFALADIGIYHIIVLFCIGRHRHLPHYCLYCICRHRHLPHYCIYLLFSVRHVGHVLYLNYLYLRALWAVDCLLYLFDSLYIYLLPL
jgi:hypothetical protein